MFQGKPVIGIAGGIGSGKSFIARMFGEMGCAVIDADALARAAYDQPGVRQRLLEWWGESVFRTDGAIDRAAIAARVFSDPAERRRLEDLVHPLVAQMRQQQMQAAAPDPQLLAFVWDTPLLFEAGLQGQCDALVFVDAPLELRQRRVMEQRSWDPPELARRENLQSPLDRKRKISDYIVQNTADAGNARRQVREVLSRILARTSDRQIPR